MRRVERHQVVVEPVLRTFGERVQLLQRRREAAAAEDQAFAAAGADGREGVDAVVSPADLDVQGKAPGDDGV